jgi:hypothetical protein
VPGPSIKPSVNLLTTDLPTDQKLPLVNFIKFKI